MQPGDITEDEVRKMVEDGQEVLFITADVRDGYGLAKIEDGKLVFHTRGEILRRQAGTP
jgi:hypothetical protein